MEKAPEKAPPKIPIRKGGAISQSHSRWPLILIGAGKLLKAAGLVFIAFLAKYLINQEQRQGLLSTLDDWRLDPQNHHLYWALEKVLAIDSTHLRVFRVGAIIYAVLFLIEGIGLILDFAWAEWLLVVTTGLLLPVEIWEMIDRHKPLPVIIFVLNVAVMIYVCYRLKWRLQDHRAKKRALEAPAESAPPPEPPVARAISETPQKAAT